jgi:hypothetical protein
MNLISSVHNPHELKFQAKMIASPGKLMDCYMCNWLANSAGQMKNILQSLEERYAA